MRYTKSMWLLVGALLLLSLGGTGLGVFISHVVWLRRRRQSIATTTLIAQYDLPEKLTPVEFALLCDGRMTRQAAIGQVVYLAMKGIVDLSRDPNQNTVAVSFHRGKETATDAPVVHELLPLEGQYRHLPISRELRTSLERDAEASLQAKGWLDPKNDFGEKRFKNLIVIMAAVTLAMMVVSAVALVSGAASHDNALAAIVLVVSIVVLVSSLVTIVFGTFVYHLVRYFYQDARIARRVNAKFRQHYNLVYGIYLYLRVSGSDTMTPDYATLDLSGLDALYPYAIAAGLDEQIGRFI